MIIFLPIIILLIYIFSIFPFINKNKDILIIDDYNIKKEFELYNEFINALINNYNNQKIIF